MTKERLLIIAAFAAIYFIWGATYLANWYAVQDMPPFLMSAARFFTAGLILFGVGIALGQSLPTRRNWQQAFWVGTFFLGLGTGGVVWSMQYLDSSMAALLIGGEPLVILLLMWLLKSTVPKWNGLLGVGLGILGMYLLVGQPHLIANSDNLKGLIAIAISMLSWGVIAVKLNDFDLPSSKLLSSAMQMMSGGFSLLLFSLWIGEYKDFSWASVTPRGVGAWIFLIFFGSIVAFSAFNYLLTKVSPDKVATSNYVNPVVALLLGWGLNNEEITTQSLIAAVILIFGVFLINSKSTKFSLAKSRKKAAL